MSEAEEAPRNDEREDEAPKRTPLWQHPLLAVIAALVAVIGLVWRCA